jgi:hypothetical protein
MYTLIEHKKLDAAAASITFSSIPATFTDLMLKVSLRASTDVDFISFALNSSTSNFTTRGLQAFGSNTVNSDTRTDGLLTMLNNNSIFTANTFSNVEIYIPNYASAVVKSFSVDAVTENNATDARRKIIAGLWNDTASITSVTLNAPAASNFVSGSSATLYGINRTQAIGKPKAIGGNITYANGHWVHTFTGSGNFVAQEDMDLEYLVVAGGGGGGGGSIFVAASGGGAGGYRSSLIGEPSGGGSSSEIPLKLKAGVYPVTVGAGGAAGPNLQDAIAGQGSLSAFHTISATGGGFGINYRGSSSIGGSGGSGGGGGAGYTSIANIPGGSGTAAQGFAGASGINVLAETGWRAGGGGGAGAAGSTGGSGTGGVGGIGVSSSITGSPITRAGGGGGAGSGAGGAGGVGGGGAGAAAGSATPGTANTGGGGGGAANANVSGASGGSGVVIVRYRAD